MRYFLHQFIILARFLVTLLLFTSTTVYAADVVLPGSVAPSRLRENLAPSPSQPSPPVAVQPPAAKKAAALNPAVAKQRLKLKKIILEGEHVFSEQQLRPLYEKQLNTEITVAELFAIAQRITEFYRGQGYVLSEAVFPPQHLDRTGAVIRIRIIEGFINQVNVIGTPKGARDLVQAYGNHVAESRPFQISQLERYIHLANDIPGTQVQSVIKPSKIQGAADIDLVTKSTPFSGYISYDNYGTKFLGPQELTANAQLNSIFRSGDNTQMTAVNTTDTREMLFTHLAHETPIGTNGMRLSLGTDYSKTNPGSTLARQNIDGDSHYYYGSIKYPVIRTLKKSLTLRGGFNYTDSTVDIQNTLLYNDHVRTINLGANYELNDHFGGNSVVDISATKGLKIFGASSNPQATDISRAGGRAVYTKFNLQANHTQPLWNNFSFFVLAQGQYTVNPLLISEQFGFGGAQGIGRGYDPSELLGDRGMSGTAELRYNLIPDWRFLKGVQLYGFYDAGKVWNILPASGQSARASATSTGMGTRFMLNSHCSGNLMFAKPLTHDVAAFNNKGGRVYFSIVLSG